MEKETLEHKIEILFKLPIVNDEYKVKRKLEGGKRVYEIRGRIHKQTLQGNYTPVGRPKKKDDGNRAWISCGNGWENINDTHYPQNDCWLMKSEDRIIWGKKTPQKFLECNLDEYRIGRPKVNRITDVTYELRVTSDTRAIEYSCFRLSSRSGKRFTSKRIQELPRGRLGAWDEKMTYYPIRLDTSHGESYLFYNGDEMVRTSVGFASLKE